MLVMESVIIKESHGELLQHFANYLPIGGADVSTKWLAAGEEELARNNAGESMHNIWMELDLTKGRLNVVGV